MRALLSYERFYPGLPFGYGRDASHELEDTTLSEFPLFDYSIVALPLRAYQGNEDKNLGGKV